MSETTLMDQVFAQENRHDPYPLFAELLKTPVARQPDGSYVVSGYAEIVALLHDPRVSSDTTKRGLPRAEMKPAFINTDPPTHDRLRGEATSFFGPPHRPHLVASLEPWMHETVNHLIDGLADKRRIDIVEELAYPFPVSAICRVLGVPREDEPEVPRLVGDPHQRPRLPLAPRGARGGPSKGPDRVPGALGVPQRARRSSP